MSSPATATEIARLKQRFETNVFMNGFVGAEEAVLEAAGKEMVWLSLLREPVLIVPAATGIVYRCQVGSYGCVPKWMEGFLIPVLTREPDAAIFRELMPFEWDGDPERYIGEVARQIGPAQNAHDLEIVPHEDNLEAWLWARFELNGRERFGVVTWENSDWPCRLLF